MEVVKTPLPGVLLIKPRLFGDERGFFLETFSAARYSGVGVPGPFIQDNLSLSQRGVLRGLHLQHPFSQGKLVSVPVGEVFDVVVDVRAGSPTFGRWFGALLNGENHHQLYIPPAFAHGFCALRDNTLFSYKCTELYHPETELGARWDDPDLAIEWPIVGPTVSEKDGRLPRLREISVEKLPQFAGSPSS